MELLHDDLTQIEDDLPEVDGFVHDNTNLSHVAPHQVLAKSYSRLEIRFHPPLEICLLVCHKIDIPMLPDVLHRLPKH